VLHAFEKGNRVNLIRDLLPGCEINIKQGTFSLLSSLILFKWMEDEDERRRKD
jgi:hypothetical protein